MWAQLAMAGVKSLQDAQNRKNEIASNVITQKYSPWTGKEANFSAIGKNNTMSNLIAGYGSGLLQDKLDAQEAANKIKDVEATDPKGTPSLAEMRSWEDQYMAAQKAKKSSFAPVAQAPAAPSRSPAFDVEGNQRSSFDLSSAVNPYKDPTPLMLQGQVPGAQNPWLALAKTEVIPGKIDPVKEDPTAQYRTPWTRRY